MSIYSSHLVISDDDHELACGRYQPCSEADALAAASYAVDVLDQYYRWIPEAVCTCPSKAPLVYQGSHVNPDDSHPRGGVVDFAAIPNHCHPSVRGKLDEAGLPADEGPPVEYARLSLAEDPGTYGHQERGGDAVVVLDRRQVTLLRDALSLWLVSRERW